MLRGVRGPKSKSFLAGNLQDLYDIGGLPHLKALADYGGVAKVHGLFGDVLLSISDPRALAHVLVNEVQKFPAIDVSGTYDMHRYLMGPGLLSTNGPVHRRQRKQLNPAFSPTQIRRLAPLMSSIASQLRDIIVSDVTAGIQGGGNSRTREIDMAEWLGRAAVEILGQAGFGQTFHTLEGDGDKYVHAVKDLIPSIAALGSYIPLFVMSGASRLPPRLLRVMGKAASFISPALRRMMGIVDLMNDEMHAIWGARKAALRDGKQGTHAALLDVLLEASEEDEVSNEVLSSQSTTLVLAGAETTSSALSRVLQLLALHKEAQDRLREEILQGLSNAKRECGDETIDELGYDTLMALPFLDAVCKEALRVFPPAPLRNRRCIEESVLPLSDGTSVHVPAGTEILINIHGINTNVDLWGPDADVWRPERWLEPLPESVSKLPGVYANTLSFLVGPKSCIGLNFALLEMKTAIAVLIPTLAFKLPMAHEIEWRFGQTITPSVKGEKGLNPRMPLRIEVL
ncbi:cytochrome P450 [Peniophora sp. CONT]|nr:cytochrome P450 [Peniophora sp. CONT]